MVITHEEGADVVRTVTLEVKINYANGKASFWAKSVLVLSEKCTREIVEWREEESQPLDGLRSKLSQPPKREEVRRRIKGGSLVGEQITLERHIA